MRIQLTKDFRKVSTSYGLFQNLSGDANIELTENVQSDGIILRPFQIVTVNRTVWARKVSGAGTGVLAVLPFVDSEETSDETSDDDTSDINPPLPPPRPPAPPNPYDCFENFPPRPPHDEDGYVIQIPRALIERGQHKFIVDFPR
ncbi:MAG: hypothetical protein IJP68_13110 [Selenomonadaceae bacterium]|nr:hypothetical protein [Selenomonadaceae bacterium]